MFLGSGVAIDVAACNDVTQNSCLERSQFGIVYRSTGQLCPTLGTPAGAGLDPEKGSEIVIVQRRKIRLTESNPKCRHLKKLTCKET